MAQRRLLTEEERGQLFVVPTDGDALARHYTLTRADQDLVATRRSDANRRGFALQLALLRHHGFTLVQTDGSVDALVAWMATHLSVPAALSVCRGR